MKSCKAFTLIELLIVVAIIGILAAIAIPNFISAKVRAEVAKVQSDFHSVDLALRQYHFDCGDIPVRITIPPTHFSNYILNMHELTTPIGYLNSLPEAPWKYNIEIDQLSPTPNYKYYHGFRYMSLRKPNSVKWVLQCDGPGNMGEIRGGFLFNISNGIYSKGVIELFGS